MSESVASSAASAQDMLGPRDASQAEAAERELRAALASVAGTGSRGELEAVLALAQHSGRAYRETEALVLARRAMRLADAAGDVPAGATAHNLLSAALEGLEDWDALLAECDRLLKRAAPLPEKPRAWLTLAACRRRVAVALGRRDGEEAERHFLAAVAAGRTVSPGVALADLLPLDLVEVRLVQGRFADADRALEDFVDSLPKPMASDVALLADSVRARVAFVLGAKDARSLVVSVLARVADIEGFAAGLRRTLAVSVAADLERAGAPEALVDRLLEAAAHASVERALAIQSFLSAAGAAVPIEPEDLAILARARDRAVERSPRLVAAIGRGLPCSPAEQCFVERRSGMRTRVVVCAWCGRVRVPGAAWVPIQQIVPLDGSTGWGVTHELCADCCRSLGPPR